MSLRHRCPESVQPESGRNHDIPIRQVHLTDPWFMLIDDAVILVTFCPWCGEKLQVQKEAQRRTLVVHGLGEGRALCGLPGIPRDWPLDHQWVGWADTEKMNCQKCIEASKVAHQLWADRDKANQQSINR